MTNIETATARELRTTFPSKENYMDAVEYLYKSGWKFQPEDSAKSGRAPYAYGWWTKEDHPTKCRLTGDAGQFHLKAWDTLKTYVAQ